MSVTVWEWWDGGKVEDYVDFIEVETRPAWTSTWAPLHNPAKVVVRMGRNDYETIGVVSMPPDLAEEFARALLEAAAQVRAMGDGA